MLNSRLNTRERCAPCAKMKNGPRVRPHRALRGGASQKADVRRVERRPAYFESEGSSEARSDESSSYVSSDDYASDESSESSDGHLNDVADVRKASLWMGESQVDQLSKLHTTRTLQTMEGTATRRGVREYAHVAQLHLQVETPLGIERTVLTLLDSGGFNNVYTFPADDRRRRVLRISQRALDREQRLEFQREVGVMHRLARLRIVPEVFAVYAFACGRVGVEMERYDVALDNVEQCPTLTRRVYVENDGESAVIDLYVRASQHIWCVDTRPANVVVRFGREGGSGGAQLEMRLIDIDTRYFCREPPPPRVADHHDPSAGGLTGLEWLRSALRRSCTFTFSSYLGFDPYTKDDPAAVAVTNILIHCIDAVRSAMYYRGSPYVRTVEVLLAHWACCMALSRRCTVMMRHLSDASTFPVSSAHRMLARYSADNFRSDSTLRRYIARIVQSGPIPFNECIVRAPWWRIHDGGRCEDCGSTMRHGDMSVEITR